jgi:hypothetical protein
MVHVAVGIIYGATIPIAAAIGSKRLQDGLVSIINELCSSDNGFRRIVGGLEPDAAAFVKSDIAI